MYALDYFVDLNDSDDVIYTLKPLQHLCMTILLFSEMIIVILLIGLHITKFRAIYNDTKKLENIVSVIISENTENDAIILETKTMESEEIIPHTNWDASLGEDMAPMSLNDIINNSKTIYDSEDATFVNINSKLLPQKSVLEKHVLLANILNLMAKTTLLGIYSLIIQCIVTLFVTIIYQINSYQLNDLSMCWIFGIRNGLILVIMILLFLSYSINAGIYVICCNKCDKSCTNCWLFCSDTDF